MPKINILPPHLAELIAAGEVVERPSAVIKELVENSIDAHAKRITVKIKNGGKTFMRVTDDGQGILKEDIKTAFLRHATSKVKNQEDLYNIATLGFRGEALASICAVSKVQLVSKTKGEEFGYCYKIEGGEERFFEQTGAVDGTTITIKELFYNVPARLKFLKTDAGEGSAIAGVLAKIALSHPEVSFNFIRDAKQELFTIGDGQLKSAIYAVYGKEAASSLIPVEYQSDGIEISGFVAKPAYSRPNRNMQHFFINGRYIKNLTLMSAVESAFQGSLMVKKFPVCVLHITLPFNSVDVNVHPAKTEIKFADEKTVFSHVYKAIKLALNAKDTYKNMSFSKQIGSDYEKKYTFEIFDKKNEKNEQKHEKNAFFLEKKEQKNHQKINLDEPLVLRDSNTLAQNWKNTAGNSNENDFEPEILVPNIFKPQIFKSDPIFEQNSWKNNDVPQKNETNKQKTPEKREETPSFDSGEQKQLIFESEKAGLSDRMCVIGELFNTYILVQISQKELILVDKHAAHERILFEKLKTSSEKNNAQFLLEPLPVALSKEEYGIILENIHSIQKVGFELEDFGQGTVIIRAVPSCLERTEAKDSLVEIATELLANRKDLTINKLDWLYHNIACRAAIKAGDRTKKEEILCLISQLQSSPELKYCPHGRPIFVAINKREIEKQFGRG